MITHMKENKQITIDFHYFKYKTKYIIDRPLFLTF